LKFIDETSFSFNSCRLYNRGDSSILAFVNKRNAERVSLYALAAGFAMQRRRSYSIGAGRSLSALFFARNSSLSRVDARRDLWRMLYRYRTLVALGTFTLPLVAV
jgi:hypothetical protein